MSLDTLTAAFVGNIIGIMLLSTIYFCNRDRISDTPESKILLRMMLVDFLVCVLDPLTYVIDGRPGLLSTVFLYASNSWLYLSTLLMSLLWVRFLSCHLCIPFSRQRRLVYNVLFLIAVLCLVINLFRPLVFSLESNVYRRAHAFWVFVAFSFIIMLDSLFLYARSRSKVGLLRFFPITVFLLPVMFGVAIQSLLYGVSINSACVAVAITGLIMALKNETIFTDQLTGLYNHAYLRHLRKRINKKKNAYVTGIMIDLNGFKRINDRLGHAVGDEALVTAASILRDAFSEYGTVIRYAGDEFVAILNTVDEAVVVRLLDRADKLFEAWNASGSKPYTLSASMGYAVLDLKSQSMNEFMNTIDMKMYQNKLIYYRNLDQPGQDE